MRAFSHVEYRASLPYSTVAIRTRTEFKSLMPSPSPSLADLEAQMQRLREQRESLEQKRQLAREEELKVLADAYARKLTAAGFTVKEGLAALKPYASVRLAKSAVAPVTPVTPVTQAAIAPRRSVIQPAPLVPARAAAPVASPADDLNERAVRVLGDDAAGWLQRPHPLLGGQSPQQVAGLPGGLKKVHALLAAYATDA